MSDVIEMIATTVKDALEIQEGGGQRIELVSALSEGGLTPSYGLIESVVKQVAIPVNVMIRPHSKHFVYTDLEIDLMKRDIEVARKLGANGVVLGVLTIDHMIDTKKLEKLLGACEGLEVTFHRAIDETDVVMSTKQLAKYREITTILTSGGVKSSIIHHLDIINEMVGLAGHINILLGGGLTMDNIEAVTAKTTAKCFHFGGAVQVNGEVVKEKVELLVSKLKGVT